MLVSIGFLHNFFTILQEFSTREQQDFEKWRVKNTTVMRGHCNRGEVLLRCKKYIKNIVQKS